MHREIEAHNEVIRQQKEEQERIEREQDRQMIERIVAKERQLAEYERQLKAKERE